jgi:putative spermidine/putrescine transport system permease protein
MFVFLLGPFLIIFLSSFSGDATMRFPPKGLSLEWYAKVLSIKMFRTTFIVSLKIGLAATLTALILGIPVAYASVRYNYKAKALWMYFSHLLQSYRDLLSDSPCCAILYMSQDSLL